MLLSWSFIICILKIRQRDCKCIAGPSEGIFRNRTGWQEALKRVMPWALPLLKPVNMPAEASPHGKGRLRNRRHCLLQTRGEGSRL